MKKSFKKVLLVLVLVAILAVSVAPVFAAPGFQKPRNKYLGDVRATMRRIQELPGILDNLLCENDPDFYVVERQRLATEIENLKWLMVQMDIKNTLDLQSIIGAVNFYSTCGEGKYATGIADREAIKLNKILVRYGLQ